MQNSNVLLRTAKPQEIQIQLWLNIYIKITQTHKEKKHQFQNIQKYYMIYVNVDFSKKQFATIVENNISKNHLKIFQINEKKKLKSIPINGDMVTSDSQHY